MLKEHESDMIDDEFEPEVEEETLENQDFSNPELIVVASEGLDVSSHSGYCTNFNYYRVKDYSIINSQNLPARGKVDARFAEVFARFGVDVVVVNSISKEQERDFTDRGIAIARGAKGRAIDAAMDYLDGALDVSLPA